ncbi:MAG TPA: protein translocase subunit SecD, partial [Oxalicibacterium sp.]|nr:protein translocase subunit SecD [Oxalicibacterium sp.]
MNRYPLWKYITIIVALLLGVLYTLPNFFGESPAVQISSAKATVKIDSSLMTQVEDILKKNGLQSDGILYETIGTQGTVRVRFPNTDVQFKAKGVLEKQLNADPNDPTYLVAFNLLPNTPTWLQSLGAHPMYLGLDLRGGVHFLMQVDTKAVMNKRITGLVSSVRAILRDKDVRHSGIARDGDSIGISFRDAATREQARNVLADQLPELALADGGAGSDLKLIANLKPTVLKQTV